MIALCLAGCASRDSRTLTPPSDLSKLDRQSSYLKAHLKDGRVYLLSDWTLDEAAGMVRGTGQLLSPDRRRLAMGELNFPLDQVALFETNRVGLTGPMVAMALITGVSAGVSVYCLTHHKSCFGSCPTFYAWDGEKESLMAEGFSGAVAPSLEATDLDALFRARPASRDFALRMTNEALETHVVKRVRLLSARKPPGGRVLATPAGEFWEARRLIEPAVCTAAEGDCRQAVRAFDGVERTSTTDGKDLASREEIDLSFPDPGGGRLGLALGFRQGFVSTFLFYQALAYMGREAGASFARLERGQGTSAAGVREALGGIEVLVRDGDGWARAGEANEIGPIAADVQLVLLPPQPPGPVRLKLRLTRGHFRIDLAALAVLGGRAAPVRLDPASIERRGRPAPAAGDMVITGPGDEVVYRFRLPEDPERQELFLESRGYYLEWMREEWMREENPLALAELLLLPGRALKRLAPAYKELEPQFEAAFWGSRYAVH